MRNNEMSLLMDAAIDMPWAILPSKLVAIRSFLAARVPGTAERITDLKSEFQAKVVGPSDVARAQQIGNVAVIPVQGTVAHRMNLLSEFSGGTSTELLKAQVQRAAAENEVAAILLDVNSPGGGVAGLPELHSVIMEARAVKPVVASVNAMAGSAAFWIASAASEICITPSGEAGSIGVFYLHQDISKALEAEGVVSTLIKAGEFKAEGLPYFPLSDEAKEALQLKVDAFMDMFVQNVAKGRDRTTKQVKSDFGQGRMLTASAAKSVGMVDRIETIDATIQRYAKRGNAGSGRARAEFHQEVLSMGAKLAR